VGFLSIRLGIFSLKMQTRTIVLVGEGEAALEAGCAAAGGLGEGWGGGGGWWGASIVTGA